MAAEIIPTRFLFRYEIPIQRMDPPPRIDGDVSNWPDAGRLPPLHEIDGRTAFADVWFGWHDSGLYLAVRVAGKKRPLRCDANKFWTADNIRLMTDMRDARDIRRATRFCQQFYFLPTGGGKDGSAAMGGSHKIQRAQANAPLVPAGRIKVASKFTKTGYALTAHVPGEALVGFNPADHPRIGFYVMIEDSELGRQFLTVDDDLCWYFDPSTWVTGKLTD